MRFCLCALSPAWQHVLSKVIRSCAEALSNPRAPGLENPRIKILQLQLVVTIQTDREREQRIGCRSIFYHLQLRTICCTICICRLHTPSTTPVVINKSLMAVNEYSECRGGYQGPLGARTGYVV